MQQGADVLRILAYYVWQDEGSPSDTEWLLNMFDFIEDEIVKQNAPEVAERELGERDGETGGEGRGEMVTGRNGEREGGGGGGERLGEKGSVCVCVCARVCQCVCVCVCLWCLCLRDAL